jgi:hypothetical protein
MHGVEWVFPRVVVCSLALDWSLGGDVSSKLQTVEGIVKRNIGDVAVSADNLQSELSTAGDCGEARGAGDVTSRARSV